MTRRDRLHATLRGLPVDRVPVSFNGIGGYPLDPNDPDPFNVFNAPDWQPLLKLAEEETDLIRLRWPSVTRRNPELWDEFFTVRTYEEENSRFTRTTLRVGGRTMTSLTRRDADVYTVWTLEHLLKDTDDLRAYLSLPDAIFEEDVDVSALVTEEEELGDRGIVLVDTSDPIGYACWLFKMEEYMLIAIQEPALFHELIRKHAAPLYQRTEDTAKAFPGRLWRICGPELATEPYLPPALFEEYVVRYTEPMVRIIQKHGGWVRLHCHGRLKSALPYIAGMGVDAIDPIEPPHQGDVHLADVRREYGADLALFGNIQVADIENMNPKRFEDVVKRSLAEGTEGTGRGFCLMPTASPYGRTISASTMANYETMVRLARQ
jgi:hypothetical protein